MIKCEHCWDTGYYKGYGAPCGECPRDVKPTGRHWDHVVMDDIHSSTEPQYEVGMRVKYRHSQYNKKGEAVILEVHSIGDHFGLDEGVELFVKGTLDGEEGTWYVRPKYWDVEICSN